MRTLHSEIHLKWSHKNRIIHRESTKKGTPIETLLLF